MDGAQAFVPATHQTGNTRRNEILRMLSRMLRTPSMGSHWDGHKWVFLSGNEVAEAILCNRKTADADLKALADAGFLIREKLGGKARRPNGELVSPHRRSWFYRFADGIFNLLPWLAGNVAANGKPVKRTGDRPTTGQSSKDSSQESNLKEEQAQKTKQPAAQTAEQPLTGKDEVQQGLDTCAAMLQAPDQQPTANQLEQERIAEENRKRKVREEIAAGTRTPGGGSTCPPGMRGWKPGDPLPGQTQQPALGFGAA